MLIDKPVKDGDTISLKLSSGDELVATLQSQTETSFKLKTPMVLAQTAQGFGLVPYMFTVGPDSFINIEKSFVVSVAITHTDMANDYLSKVTGLHIGKI